MSKAVISKPAISAAYVDKEEVSRTIKVICRDGGALIPDVLMMIKSYGVKAEDIVGVSRGPPHEAGIYVSFKSEAPVTMLKAETKLEYRKKAYRIVALGSQILNVRVHWLPLFFSDTLIKSVLADYGKVLSVERLSERGMRSGMRAVELEVNEAGRLALPHLIRFECGTAMLLTVQGRPPLCLKCFGVGHFRRECPLLTRNFSEVVRGRRNVEAVESRETEVPEVVEPRGTVETPRETDAQLPEVQEKDGNQDLQRQPQKPDEPVERSEQALGIGTIDSGNTAAAGESNTDKEDESMEVSLSSSRKRTLGDVDDDVDPDSFIKHFPPQKVVKSHSEIQTGNRFEILSMDLTDLLEEAVEGENN